MKKSNDARLTHIEDMIQIIHDHLMDMHWIAKDALIAEADDDSTGLALLPKRHGQLDVN
jgi:hypothetical protein